MFFDKKKPWKKNLGKKRQLQKQNEMTDLQFNKIIKYKMKGIFKNVCMYVCRMYVCMYVWHYKPNTMESNSFVFPWGSEATPSATLSLKRSYKLSLAALSNMAKILLSPIFSVLEDSPKQYRGVLKIWFLAKRYVFF